MAVGDYERPTIVAGQTRRNDEFYENIFDGIDEGIQSDGSGAGLPPGGTTGQLVTKTVEGGGWVDPVTVDTLPGASTLGRSIMKAATTQLIREIAETPSLEDVEPTVNLTLAFENALA